MLRFWCLSVLLVRTDFGTCILGLRAPWFFVPGFMSFPGLCWLCGLFAECVFLSEMFPSLFRLWGCLRLLCEASGDQ